MKVFTLIFSLILLTSCGGNMNDGNAKTVVPQPVQVASPVYVAVYINDGAKQCSAAATRSSLDETLAMLTNKGVDVIESHCGEMKGIAFPAVCGAGTPGIHIHQINEKNIALAIEQGFKPISSLKDGYTEVPCGKVDRTTSDSNPTF